MEAVSTTRPQGDKDKQQKDEGKEALSILHDHYKESFALIREREKQRDLLFLYLIGVIGALFLSTQYPKLLPTALEFSPAGTKFSLSGIPIAVITSVLWTVLLTLSLRYCSYTVWIDRQYPYLNALEGKISALLGDDQLYRREGKLYNDNYPAVSWWVWAVYTLVFPTLVLTTVGVLMWLTWENVTVPRGHQWFDTVVGAAVVVTFALYKFLPLVSKLIRWVKGLFGSPDIEPKK